MAKNTTFLNELKQASTEEEVKFAYVNNFKIKFKASKKRDLYTPQILFEFKYHKKMESVPVRSAVIAQTLYYIRRIKYGETKDPLPPFICVADSDEAFFTETSYWKSIYSSDAYDWDCAPSVPDENLVKDISKTDIIRKINVFNLFEKEGYDFFERELNSNLAGQMSFDFMDKKEINEYNFVDVYDYWAEIFGEDVKNGTKPSKYFLCDIQDKRTEFIKEENKIVFHLDGETKTKKIDHKKYDKFWSLYAKVKNDNIIREIITKLDCLTDEKVRRFTGEFFTPPKFAGKALKYIESVAGKKWWKDPNYRLWDMAAGTGNLEWYLPTESHKQLYLSTLLQDDVNYCKRLFPKATSFKYNYLNDDVDYVFSDLFSKSNTYNLPDNLIKDLNNENLRWIILINPPFGTAQPGKLQTGNYKSDISKTKVQKIMEENSLGEVSRELFAQFIYRIVNEFKDKNANLCLFSKIKYLNSNNDQKFRDNVFQYKFEKGFIFASDNFSNTSKASSFPVGFLIWNLNTKNRIENQKIQVDAYDNEGYRIGVKNISTQHRDLFLNKWIERPKNSNEYIMPPLGGAINVKHSNSDTRHRTCPNFIGSLMCCGNDFQQQNLTALFSSPQASAGSHSITPEIFEQAMVVHAVRRIPKATWFNDRDQFMQPNKKLSEQFINDCVIWSLFSRSNETASLRNVQYKSKVYDIINHFFPFEIKALDKWSITEKDILKYLKHDNKNRFVSEWISKSNISKEATNVLETAEQIYKIYFENFGKLATAQFKIEWWDAGWWQIKHALNDQGLAEDLFEQLNEKQDELKGKILPQIISYGFIEG